jgi:ATP-dependent DNA ligase
VGRFERGKFHQGLNLMNRKALLKLLEPLRVSECPFANLPSSKSGHWVEGVTAEEMGDYCWVRPELVTTIRFTEWTEGGVLRHAEFECLLEEQG